MAWSYACCSAFFRSLRERAQPTCLAVSARQHGSREPALA